MSCVVVGWRKMRIRNFVSAAALQSVANEWLPFATTF
jgi:hypothetical protein